MGDNATRLALEQSAEEAHNLDLQQTSQSRQPGLSDAFAVGHEDSIHPPSQSRMQDASRPFDSQYHTMRLSQQQTSSDPSLRPESTRESPQPYETASSFNMRSLGGALPDSNQPTPLQISHHSQRLQHPHDAPNAPIASSFYPAQHSPQYHGHPSGQFGIHSGMVPPYVIGHPQRMPGSAPGSAQQGYPLFNQAGPQYGYYPPQFMPQGQSGQSFMQFPSQMADSFPQDNRHFTQIPSPYGATDPRLLGRGASAGLVPSLGMTTPGFPHRVPETGSSTQYPRGPPRKPKQSGFALWVGNLPPRTTILELKDHFSKDATKDIESLFLISKSNCAFVNYRTEAACTAAMTRFHDSRFHGVRLVCRLRRGSIASAVAASGASVPLVPEALEGSLEDDPTLPDGIDEEESTQEQDSAAPETQPEEQPRVSERYFIVKSLTVQDLDASVRNGVWATQSHNEDTLNSAYKSTESVYLIFSANKSGEYYGYARMTSAIGEDPSITLTSPSFEIHNEPDAPRSIPTPATEHAPKGRVIDDSARGTIFWEAETADWDTEDDRESVESQQNPAQTRTDPSSEWGKAFRIEWVSTNRVPFYRTRGLRNPWNANREVKIARDGTELETNCGKRLVQMFHRVGPALQGAGGGPARPY
ncbi:hypothetical protein LTR50_006506 [Elasticomyces elasticus]|nr:hypothetical protein LTR50_006506 [Elasticomyces elasticus]